MVSQTAKFGKDMAELRAEVARLREKAAVGEASKAALEEERRNKLRVALTTNPFSSAFARRCLSLTSALVVAGAGDGRSAAN